YFDQSSSVDPHSDFPIVDIDILKRNIKSIFYYPSKIGEKTPHRHVTSADEFLRCHSKVQFLVRF
ncbi:MAG: hypothetical protein M3146_08435, partial [Thermoproteota archaeon]|nr:hypothetical protein [Thermoproteota archaeon]